MRCLFLIIFCMHLLFPLGFYYEACRIDHFLYCTCFFLLDFLTKACRTRPLVQVHTKNDQKKKQGIQPANGLSFSPWIAGLSYLHGLSTQATLCTHNLNHIPSRHPLYPQHQPTQPCQPLPQCCSWLPPLSPTQPRRCCKFASLFYASDPNR